MNKLFVWLVGLANPLWSRLGADPKAIALILSAKLKMDDRGGFAMGRQQSKKSGMQTFVYLFIAMFGVFLVMIFNMVNDVPTALGFVFSFWMIYIGLMLITEMSENLFDQRDLYVLLSRPINDLTLSLSRILHIGVFASKFGLCLGVPTGIYFLGWVGGWPFFVYLLLSVFTLLITMTGTLVFYLILLRRVAPERVKKIVGYFQIVATFIFFIAYQLPSLVGDISQFKDMVMVGEPLGFAFPGLWLGGLYKAMTQFGGGWMTFAQAAIAVVAAVGGLWFYVRQSRGYADRLLALREVGSVTADDLPASGKKIKGSPVRDRLASWLTAPNLERVSFNFHWNVMLRDLTFKQRTYPAMVYMPVVLVITVFRDAFTGEEAFSVGDGTMLMLLYFVIWIIVIPLGQTKVSDQYRAAWIFEATANPYPHRIKYGQLMAVLGMFFLPTAILVYSVVLVYWGPSYWLDIVLGCGNSILFAMIYNVVDSGHPFSRAKDDSKFSNFGPLLIVSLLAPLFGFGHYFLREIPYALPVSAVIVWGMVIGWMYWMRNAKGAAAGAMEVEGAGW